MPTDSILRAIKNRMLLVFRNSNVSLLSTKRTVPLISVSMMIDDKLIMNTIDLDFPSPHSEPCEVIEMSFVHVI